MNRTRWPIASSHDFCEKENSEKKAKRHMRVVFEMTFLMNALFECQYIIYLQCNVVLHFTYV